MEMSHLCSMLSAVVVYRFPPSTSVSPANLHSIKFSIIIYYILYSFPGVKRPGREADHSPPTSAEVKKMWIYTSTPPYAFMA
jgi:hypothetical protein